MNGLQREAKCPKYHGCKPVVLGLLKILKLLTGVCRFGCSSKERHQKSNSKYCMTTVKKNQFIQHLAEKLNIPKKQAGEFLQMFMDSVTHIMKRGDKLNLSGFGIFKVAHRAARDGRNPRTGESIKIAASKKAKFVPAKALKEAVL